MAAGIGDMIMFIGAISAASVMAGVAIDQGMDMTHALEGRAEAQVLALETSLRIVNDPLATHADDLDIHALNTGKRIMVVEQVQVLIDGQAVTFTTNSASGRWIPGEVLTFTVAGSQPVGDRLVEILGPHGARDSFTYYEAGP